MRALATSPRSLTSRDDSVTDVRFPDLATLFYEWGWGQCFHFAHRYADETFVQSIKRHEYFLASRLVSA